MKTYEVYLVAWDVITVKAKNSKEAQKKAMDISEDPVWEIDSVLEKEKK